MVGTAATYPAVSSAVEVSIALDPIGPSRLLRRPGRGTIRTMYDRDLAEFHDAHAGELAREGASTMVAHLHAAGWTGGTVADLGCGGGIASRVLVDAGFDVVAVDPSPAMLAMTRERVPEATTVEATMASVALPGRLVGIVALGEALAYDLTIDLDETLEAFHAALRPGGVVLLDVPGPGRHGEEEESTLVQDRGGVFLSVQTTSERFRTTRRITLFTRNGRNGNYRRHDETHELRLYPAQDVRTGLARAGFVAVRPVARYGSCALEFGEHWPAFVAARP